jgi:hypothetical protein
MKTNERFKNVWYGFTGCAYFAVVIGILSVAKSPFETIVLAVLVQIYAGVLYNFSLIGAATDVNNYAGFVRFRILANHQGITENEDGLYSDQEEQLKDAIGRGGMKIMINQFSHGAVAIYALYKIITILLALQR